MTELVSMSLHSNNKNINLVELLLFELVERIARFHLHLEDIRIRFYPLETLSPFESDTKYHFLDSYRECLTRILEGSVILYNQITPTSTTEDVHKVVDGLQSLLMSISELHKDKLGHLPRPPEPPELKRFGRILKKHTLELCAQDLKENTQDSEISIYVNEEISEGTFAGDPLVDFKVGSLNKSINKINDILDKLNSTIKIGKFTDHPEEKSTYHITIPRIDAKNPCRWPTLIHELGHKIMADNFFKMGDILKDFESMLEEHRLVFSEDIPNSIDLKSWLTECWCDLLGAVVMGPSFWFAQTSAFLFFGNLNNIGQICRTHPPAVFRLILIQRVLNHRFPDTLLPELKTILHSYKKLIEHFDGMNSQGMTKSSGLKKLILLFQHYFFGHFFAKEGGKLTFGAGCLNNHLTNLIKYTESINADVIFKMVSFLEKGYPIPSVKETILDKTEERPTLVQEILLAAWIYRNNNFKQKITDFYKIFSPLASSGDQLWEAFGSTAIKSLDEFNFSVLRSIQVSEWFDSLQGNDEIISFENSDDVQKRENIFGGVLADFQILELLNNEEIMVIPVMNLSKQLGSTSLDIRLGTSFQVYYPNQVGIIDFTENSSVNNANKNSTLVDLDFVQAITIAPGQFILGHSMEYLKLPQNIAAEVEGRSSFARLGIEIHMTAGFIDPGFQGVLTFEIYNAGPNPVRLFPGYRIGQLRFFHGSPPRKPYDKNPSAKYRGLLSHHNSLQFRDYEINLLAAEIRKQKNNMVLSHAD